MTCSILKSISYIFAASSAQLGQEPRLPGYKLWFLGNRDPFPLPNPLITLLGKWWLMTWSIIFLVYLYTPTN